MTTMFWILWFFIAFLVLLVAFTLRKENEERMRKLRDQFKDQNKQIEQASSGRRPSLPAPLASTRLC